MRRETQNILLVLLGGALLKISFTGTYLRYVKPAHLWLLVLAGVVMIALAAVSIGRELAGRRTSTGDDHHHPGRSAWLLVLPVLAVFLVAPPALGSDSVERAGDSPPRGSQRESVSYPPLPAGDVLPLSMSEFVERAAWDATGSLDGRTVRLKGFVVHEGDTAYLARLRIFCCAADAFPVKVELVGDAASRFADDSWVEVVAELVPGSSTEANHRVPSVTVESISPIPEPADPYDH
ncbi:TIGR03943 family putative permease subunit [Actinophytocola gossypii]|uniref:TIGR03943 family protein n=1 Tax=Actinophytocola gossypii TaxID=2812003 RepID=A0ABT2JCI3_9PSEU|nr:TIGR03943 family protein [Actinophytocola gossypii]MCT2585560.1 TIGR03943 family protein [Actinophytocola gossypii]